jgi:lipoate-protein ligase A
VEGAATLTAFWWDDGVARPAWQQMAIDRVLVDHASAHGTTVYRLYRWVADTVSFGANEAARRTWDRDRLERAQLPCVRRPTGGRGVWHDATDLTYAVTAPLAAFGDLRLAYRLIHDQLATAFRELAIDASVAAAGRRPVTLEPGACFDIAVGGEVLVAGRKTIGSAQALFGTSFLQHGAIARTERRGSLARFRLVSSPEASPVPVSELPALDALGPAIVAAWRAAGAVPAPASLVAWADEASGAYRARFDDPAWTWRR